MDNLNGAIQARCCRQFCITWRPVIHVIAGMRSMVAVHCGNHATDCNRSVVSPFYVLLGGRASSLAGTRGRDRKETPLRMNLPFLLAERRCHLDHGTPIRWCF